MKEEPVDILDEQGNQTGQTMLKSEAHAKSLWHPVAHLWIYNSKGQLLLQKRAPDKQVWPNVWDVSVAGHIAAGDKPKDTIIREAKEELGIKIVQAQVEFFDLSPFNDKMPGGWFNRVYIYSYITEEEIDISDLVLEEEETSEVRWVDINNLRKELAEAKNHFSPAGRLFFKTAINETERRLGR